MTDDFVDDAAKKMKNSQQDAEAKAETTEDHAEGKPSSETYVFLINSPNW